MPLDEGLRPLFKPSQINPEAQMKAKMGLQQPVEEEKSFFQKYWLYILIGGFMFMNVLGGAGKQEEGAGQAQQK